MITQVHFSFIFLEKSLAVKEVSRDAACIVEEDAGSARRAVEEGAGSGRLILSYVLESGEDGRVVSAHRALAQLEHCSVCK